MEKKLDLRINNKAKMATLAVLLTAIIVVSIVASMTSANTLGDMTILGQPYAETDYKKIYGILHNDTYLLYPYENKSVDVGFSKYGELMNPYAPCGLNYSGIIDPFANTFVARQDWNEGWVLNCTYIQSGQYRNVWAFALYSDTLGSGDPPDLDWQHVSSGLSTPYCGRKTNAYAISYPIETIYNGPRKAVYRLKTVISTNTTVAGFNNDKILELTFHVIFEKVKKYVLWIKDIKRVDVGKGIGTMQIEFSERGQWDMERASHPLAYAHWFVNQSTSYNKHVFYNGSYAYYNEAKAAGYDVCQIISKSLPYTGWAAFWPNTTVNYVEAFDVTTVQQRLSTLSTQNDYYLRGNWPGRNYNNYTWYPCTKAPVEYPRGEGHWSSEPMVFVNDVVRTRGTHYKWMYNGTHWGVNFYSVYTPTSSDYIRVVYKSTEGVLQSDMSPSPHEPATPYVIGEWAFDLTWANATRSTNQFRCITAYGITDIHDAADADQSGIHPDPVQEQDVYNILDREAKFQLDELFNPWDLSDSVHKQESDWLYKTALTSTATYVALTSGLNDRIWQNKSTGTWYGYKLQYSGAGSLADWVNSYENGSTYAAHSKNWALLLQANASGYARVRITPEGFGQNGTYRFGNLTEISFWYKKLTAGNYGPHIFVKLSNGSSSSWVNIQMYNNEYDSPTGWTHLELSNIATFVGYDTSAYRSADYAFWYDSDSWTKGSNGPMNGVDSGAGTDPTDNGHSFDFYRNKLANYYVTDVVVELGYNLAGSTLAKYLIDDINVGYLTGAGCIRHERVYNMEEDKLIPSYWDQYNTFAERVIINGTLWARHDSVKSYETLDPSKASAGTYRDYYTIDFTNGTLRFYRYNEGTEEYEQITLRVGTTIKILYSTIEFCTIGRYEWNVVGTVSAAIDSAGAAMISDAFEEWKDIEVYKAALELKEATWGPYAPYLLREQGVANRSRSQYRDSLNRLHLKDDWCSTYPISSSNIIVVGGPSANGLAEYFNDFTDAFLTKSDVSTSDLTGWGIYAPGCWNKTRAYYGGASGASGYAVISTYLDLNGTIGFIVWGYDGQDTYYACYALRHGLIAYLQYLQPGVTTIILKFTYTGSCAPTISIVECLGIFTECTGFGQFTYLGEGGATYVRTNYVLPLARRLFIEHKLMTLTWPTSIHADP
ncbi:MAG: hypothetical protein ACUVT5_00700 [Candidatus Bathyarchaeales archaeon]